MKVSSLTAFALTAFAVNSLLCRIALGQGEIDPIAFTAIRLISGAAVLAPLARFSSEAESCEVDSASWFSAMLLFAYAITFSLAYVSLDAGIGALLLFGLVQLTMMSVAIGSGERMRGLQWLGFMLAGTGLAILLWPGDAAPSLWGASLMALAGVAWGVYSIRGRKIRTPVKMTSLNFNRASVPAVLLGAAAYSSIHFELHGIVLAAISGAVTSGIGYVVWYRALPLLTTSQASIVQLLVPILASVGGIVFLEEQLTSRLLIASAMVLGGVGLVIALKGKFER